ncbi:phage protein NinX family protein [Paraburkholderia phenoliruptrix]|uniref:phage protein NinX family protein n=1 Tax=Paraburkholderia phenoliruptrix TaxID=252970 RepID=UPI0034CF770E
MKVSQLTGVLLDYWAARADGQTAKILRAGEKLNRVRLNEDTCATLTPGYTDWWQPHYACTWFTAGPIVEREHLVVWPYRILDWQDRANGVPQDFAAKRIGMPEPEATGPSYLIAAMRCFVASRFGDTVPDEA